MCQKYILKLYISGDTARSRLAIANLQTFCTQELPSNTSIEIIDLLKFPEVAEAKKILITPTLIKELPFPEERIIGDLSDSKILYFALNLPANSFSSPKINNIKEQQ